MRTASRSPVTLKIKFKSTTLDQFIERYSVDISHGGIFIRTKDPLPVGTNLKFEFQLKDASPLITGDGTVVWTRDFDPTRSGVAPGMGVRFDRLPSESQDVLEKILVHKTTKMGKANEPAFVDTPTRVAFGNLPTRVTPKDLLEELNQGGGRRTLPGIGPRKDETTPLPQPRPYHGELDDFPDEAFEEATKVAALEALARRSAETADPSRSLFGKSLDEDETIRRRGSATHRPPGPQEPARQSAGDIDAPPASAAPIGPAPIFHSLPSRLPFSADDRREESEGRPTEPAEPFSQPSSPNLPGREGDAARARSTSQPLRIIQPLSRNADTIDEEGPTCEARATAELPPEAPRPGSNVPWFAAAAALLVIGGASGFLLLRDKGRDGGTSDAPPAAVGQKSGQTSPVAPTVLAQPAVSPLPPPAPSVDVAASGGIDVTVQSEPAGAVAELVGTSQSGQTPMTFHGLVAGQSYQVKISKAGYLGTELTVKPEDGAPQQVQLEAKPAVLRVTSDPAGAQVWINGRRLRSLTPADVRLSARTAERKRLSLSVRKAGYATADQQVALDGLVDEGETMVQKVALVLERRPTVREVAPADRGAGTPPPPSDAGSDQVKAEEGTAAPPPAPGRDTPTDAPTTDTGTPAGNAESSPEQSEAPSSIHNERNPIPDWMKP